MKFYYYLLCSSEKCNASELAIKELMRFVIINELLASKHFLEDNTIYH